MNYLKDKDVMQLINNIIKMPSDHVTTHHREISNPWTMGKDGKRRYSKSYLLSSIKGIAKSFYKNKKERIANERKMFYRWVGK